MRISVLVVLILSLVALACGEDPPEAPRPVAPSPSTIAPESTRPPDDWPPAAREPYPEERLDDEPIEEMEEGEALAELLAACREAKARALSMLPESADEVAAQTGAEGFADLGLWAEAMMALAKGEIESRADRFLLFRALALTRVPEGAVPLHVRKARAAALAVAAGRLDADPDLGLLFLCAYSNEDALWEGMAGFTPEQVQTIRSSLARQLRERVELEVTFRKDLPRPICEAVAMAVSEGGLQAGRLSVANVVRAGLTPAKRREGTYRLDDGDPIEEVRRVIRAVGEDLLVGIRMRMVARRLMGE
ncbi:MAG: hypothetical protein R3F20_02160 [Planctomycetota bacterium]